MFLQVHELSKGYDSGGVKYMALKQASMELALGEIGVILGPSGSGKSTLLNLIGGIDRADSGLVSVGGRDITRLTDEELTAYRRDTIGFVFQFYNLIPNLTVYENVEVAAQIAKDPLDIAHILEAVGMLEFKDRFPKELSGGQQQRVSIARALVKKPKLLLCDEPTGALDLDTSKEILKLLEVVNQQYGTSMMIITHNQAIASMAHRVIRFRSGTVIENSTNSNRVGAERIDW